MTKKTEKKAVKKLEKAVRQAVNTGLSEIAVAQAIDHALIDAKAKKPPVRASAKKKAATNVA